MIAATSGRYSSTINCYGIVKPSEGVLKFLRNVHVVDHWRGPVDTYVHVHVSLGHVTNGDLSLLFWE